MWADMECELGRQPDRVEMRFLAHLVKSLVWSRNSLNNSMWNQGTGPGYIQEPHSPTKLTSQVSTQHYSIPPSPPSPTAATIAAVRH